MKYHFISDNVFFMVGVKGIDRYLKGSVSYINASDNLHALDAFPGDVVILIVSNESLRMKILNYPVMRQCRLLILLDMPILKSSRKLFPWVLTMDVTLADLVDSIDLARNTTVCPENTSALTRGIFSNLSDGMPVSRIARDRNLTEKHVYRLKRNVLIRYGLENCNSVGVLVCRDIFNMNRRLWG